MKKLVFVFATVLTIGLTSCFDNKPAGQEGKQDSIEQVQPTPDATNPGEAPEVAPEEGQKDAAKQEAAATDKDATVTPDGETAPAENADKK